MTQSRRLSIVLALNVAMIAGLIIVGLSSHSLGVLAAGGDYAADSTALLLGLIAIQIRKQQGNPNATTYVALMNASLLLIVTAFVVVEGIHRIVTHTPEIHGLPVLIVSAMATLFMVIGAIILGKDAGKEDLHMRSVYLDTVSDAAASAVVAVSGAIIFFDHGLYWLDSLLAVVIGLVIGLGAVKLVRDVATALRTKKPVHLDDN